MTISKCITLLICSMIAAPAYGAVIIPHADLTYLGAFTTPVRADFSVPHGGGTFWPAGDPTSSDDYPGSLFVTAKLNDRKIAEISIPTPEIRVDGDWDALPKATVLQEPTDITDGWTWYVNDQTEGEYTDNTRWTPKDVLVIGSNEGLASDSLLWILSKEYTMGQYEDNVNPETGLKDIPIMTLGGSDTNFTDVDGPNTTGKWRLTPDYPAMYSGYLMKVPSSWSGGGTIAAGLNRNSNGGGHGISLNTFAINPATYPPADKSTFTSTTQIAYVSGEDDYDTTGMMERYIVSNTPGDGVWVNIGSKNSIVFLTTHAERDRIGAPRYDNDPQYLYGTPPLDMAFASEGKGYTGGPYQYALLFYDPEDILTYDPGVTQPQPYAMLTLGAYTFSALNSGKNIYGQISYDETNGLLYVEEIPQLTATAARSVFHVFQVTDTGTTLDETPPTDPSNLQITASSATEVSLSFTPGADAISDTWHVITRNGFPMSYLEPGTTTFTDTYVDDWAARGVNNFIYKVIAFDDTLNYSSWSNTVSYQITTDNYSDITYFHNCETLSDAQIGGDVTVYPHANAHVRENLTPVFDHGAWGQREYSTLTNIGVEVPMAGNISLSTGRLGFSTYLVAGTGFTITNQRPIVSGNNSADDFSLIVTAYSAATGLGNIRVGYRGVVATYSDVPFTYDDTDGLLHFEFKFDSNSCTVYVSGDQVGVIESSSEITSTRLVFLEHGATTLVPKASVDGIMATSSTTRSLYAIRGEINMLAMRQQATQRKRTRIGSKDIRIGGKSVEISQ